MRILRIYNRYPPMPGGMEKHIFYLTGAAEKPLCKGNIQ